MDIINNINKTNSINELPEYESIYTLEDEVKHYNSLKNQMELLDIKLKQSKEYLLKTYSYNINDTKKDTTKIMKQENIFHITPIVTFNNLDNLLQSLINEHKDK